MSLKNYKVEKDGRQKLKIYKGNRINEQGDVTRWKMCLQEKKYKKFFKKRMTEILANILIPTDL